MKRSDWAIRAGITGALLWALAFPVSFALAQDGSSRPQDKPHDITVFEEKASSDQPVDEEGPGFKAERRQRELSEQSEEKLDISIEILKELIGASPDDDPDKPDYYMNLADAYWEKSEVFFDRAYDEALESAIFAAEKQGDGPKAAALQAKQQAYLDGQHTWRVRTVETYKTVAFRFPNSLQLDEVLYYLGLHQTLVGQPEEGYQSYVKLLQVRPSSPYVPDALVNIGEYFFDRNEFDTALAFYDKVSNGFPSATVYAFAVYKGGWCHFNMGDYDRSLDAFLRVIKHSDASGQAGASRIGLKKEAQKDLVRAYSMTGNPNKAMMFFKTVAPAIQNELGLELANLYATKSEFPQAIKLYRHLIAADPSGHLVLHYQRKIVEAVYKGQGEAETVKEVGRMLRLYEKIGPSAPPDWLAEEKRAVESELRVISTTWHKEAETAGDNKKLGRAADLYRDYVRLFPQGEHAYPIAMNQALLLKTLGRNEEAGAAFERVIELNPTGRYASEAAYFAMYSYYLTLDVGRGEVKSDAEAEGLDPLPIPALPARMVAACERYLASAGDDAENAPEAIYAAGKIYYDHNHFDKAIGLLSRMVTQFKDSANAPDAATLLLSSFNLKHDFKSLEAWAIKLADTPLASGDLQQTITRIRDQAEFNRCFERELEKEYGKAGECFMAYADRYPNTPLLDRALFNAAVNYNRDRQVQQALVAYGELYNRTMKSRLAPRALFAIGQIYRNLAIYSEAARHYEQFVQNHRKHELVEQALRYASTFRKALGETKEAVANYKLYLRLFPKSESAPSVEFECGLIYEGQKDWRAVERHFKAFLKHHEKTGEHPNLVLGAHLKIGIALWNRKRYKNAIAAFDLVVVRYKNMEPEARSKLTFGVGFVAEAMFMLGENTLRESRGIRLTARNLETAFQKKLNTIAGAREIFLQVIQLKQPNWIIAGLNRVGLAYEELSTTIENAPLPRGLNSEQKEYYREDLFNKAQGIKDKAVRAYNECLSTAAQLQWFNQYSEQATKSLSKLDYSFKFMKEYRERPHHYGSSLSPPPFRGLRKAAAAPEDMPEPAPDEDGGVVGKRGAR